jgi:tetratricopeptide (TPR) repeat protein
METYPEAIRELQSLRHDPAAPATLQRDLGAAQLASGDLASAASNLTQYVQTHPGDACGHLLLGMAYSRQGQNQAATGHFQAAAADPTLASDAREYLQRASSAAPTVPTDALTAAAAPQRRWNFTVLSGHEYDSNVGLSPEFSGLGAVADKSDNRWMVASFGDFRLIQRPDRNLGLIMSTFDSFHFNQDEFDTDDFMGGAYTNVALGDYWIAGLRYEYHHTLLDGDRFAQEHRLVPNVSLRQGDFGHLTGYYEFDAADFDDEPLIPELDRNGDTHGVGLTQAIYTARGLGRIFVGYRFEKVFADGDDWDRQTHMATARIEQPLFFTVGQPPQWIVDAEFRQFWDDYDHPNSLDFFGRVRHDDRSEVRAGIQFYFNAHESMRVDYTFITSNSNVANLFDVHFFEFDRHIVSTQFIYDF